MADDERELNALNKMFAGLVARFNAISANAATAGAKELSADLSLAKARIQAHTADLARLRDGRPDGMGGMARSIDQLRRSMEETNRSLCGLESLLKERIRDRHAARFNRGGV